MCAQMLEKANGTFLWASLVFKQLEELEDSVAEDDAEVLNLLKDIPSDLTELYHRMMGQIDELPDTPFKDRTRCLTILSTMALAYQPIQLIELPALIGFKSKKPLLESVTKLVQKCGSFLTIRDGTIYFIYQSAKDYLVGVGSDRLFKSSYEAVHRQIFSHALDAMSSGENLRRNIYSLSCPGVVLHEITVPDPDPLRNIRYSCIYWLRHFCESFACDTQVIQTDQASDVNDVEKIHKFFQRYFLNWLEALSLMKQIQDGIVSLQALIGLLKEQLQEYQGFKFFKDAIRFLLYNRFTIEEAPLQTYVSALMFSPMKSVIRLHFEEELSWVKTLPIVDEYWSSCVHTFQFDYRSFISLRAISSDVKYLASVSEDKTIKIWDVATGKNISTLEINQRAQVSIESFGDSILLALSSPLRLWDVTMKRRSVDIATGKEVRKFSASENYEITQLSGDFRFSAEESRVKREAKKRTINIINTSTGERRHAFDCYPSHLCVVFSKESKFFAVQLQNLTISIRDTITNVEVRALSRLKCCVTMEFEGDSKLIVYQAGTINIWDVVNGLIYQISTPRDLEAEVFRASFSRNAKFLISSVLGDTKVWDIAMMAELEEAKNQQQSAASLALSNDAKLIALSFDRSPRGITIKSTNTGNVEHTLFHQVGYSSQVDGIACKIAFSNVSRLLATVSQASDARIFSVSLWSTETGKEVLKWQYEDIDIGVYTTGDVSLISLAFSRDSTLLAIVHAYDRIIRVWDTKMGQQVYALRSSVTMIGRLEQLVFSYDSKFLAFSVKLSDGIGVWDLESEKFIPSIANRSETVDVFFDGSMLCMATDRGYVGLERLHRFRPQKNVSISAFNNGNTL
ncbi:hypothetical protein ACHAQJ_005652 [Trichoderma viride]